MLGIMTAHGQSKLPDETIVSYWGYKKELRKVLSDLTEQTKINISYDASLIPKEKKVLVNVKSKSLGYTLNQILRGTGLRYKIIGNQLVIVEDEFGSLLDDEFTISGIIQDSITNEKLIYANVYLGNGNQGVESNEFGYYTIQVPKGNQSLNVSYVGYPQWNLPIKVRRDTVINIKINPNILLKEIVIIDTKIPKREEIEDAIILPVHNLNSMASLGGEPDIIRMVQSMAGVTSAADGFGGIHVRGGSVDQNLILMDGVPVYNPSHTFGLFSIFNPSAIQSAKLIKNGFPARYGGRLSSVLDIITRDGNKQKFGGNIKLNLPIMVSGTLEGPLEKEKSSFFFSGRRTTLDPFIKEGTSFLYDAATQSGSANYYFYDINGKINLQLSDKHRWYFSIYSGTDHFENQKTSSFEEETQTLQEENINQWDWGNTLGSFRWNMILSQKASANLKVYYNQFNFEYFDLDRSSLFRLEPEDTRIVNASSLFISNIEDLGGQIDFQIQPSNHYTTRFGVNFVQHNFNPGSITVDQNRGNTPNPELTDKNSITELLQKDNLSGSETRFHFENIFNFGRSMINAGVHGVLIHTGDQTQFIAEPRFTSSLQLFNGSYFKLSYTMMDQYMHLLSGTGLGLPNDFWLPSTDEIKPERSVQYSGGFDFHLGKSWFFSVIGFRKELSDVITYPEVAPLDVNSQDNWENEVAVGNGTSNGLEVSLVRNVGRFATQINYTYSKSDRLFENINNGDPFPYRFDRRHVVNFNSLLKFSESAEVSINWTYGSGIPFSEPVDLLITDVQGIPQYVPLIPSRNNSRFNPNHRLDVSFNFYSRLERAGIRYSIGVHNLYGQKNALYTDIIRTDSTTSPFARETYFFPGPIPFISIDFNY